MHKWEAFVDIKNSDKSYKKLPNPNDIIEKVIFELHPSFKNPIRTVKKEPFCLKSYGWGHFDLPMLVVFKSEYKLKPLKLVHHLCFDGDGEI